MIGSLQGILYRNLLVRCSGLLWEFGADAAPEVEADELVTRFEAEHIGVYVAPMANDKAAQHLYLLRFAGGVSLKGYMLGKLFDGLPVVVLLLCFSHDKK